MNETRDFPTAVIASISTGVLLYNSFTFSEMHEAAEYLMGHPICTHQFASEELHDKMQRTIIAQCPDMPTVLPDVNVDNYLEKLADIEAKIGKVVKIKKGDKEKKESET